VELIELLLQESPIGPNQTLDFLQPRHGNSFISRERNRLQPELRIAILEVDLYMRRLPFSLANK